MHEPTFGVCTRIYCTLWTRHSFALPLLRIVPLGEIQTMHLHVQAKFPPVPQLARLEAEAPPG